VEFVNNEGHKVIFATVRDPEGKSPLGAIYLTKDGGYNWKNTTPNLKKRNFWSIVMDPQNPSVVYPGWVNGGGVIRTIDGGAPCFFLSEGLPDTSVFSLSIDPMNLAVV